MIWCFSLHAIGHELSYGSFFSSIILEITHELIARLHNVRIRHKRFSTYEQLHAGVAVVCSWSIAANRISSHGLRPNLLLMPEIVSVMFS